MTNRQTALRLALGLLLIPAAGAGALAQPGNPEPEQASEPEPEPEPELAEPPDLFRAPSGRLLPAGTVYSRSGVDTGGGLSSELRLGLGDVAEFGLGITDLVRVRAGADGDAERFWPYATATFKMGIAEHRMFRHQPALALGFRKSFERERDDRDTRFAELHLVATKSLGERFTLHVGGAFWDASIAMVDPGDKDDPDDAEFVLHEKPLGKQIRPFGGLEIEPFDDASILLELVWAPTFVFHDATRQDAVELDAQFSWGVRYRLNEWGVLESGVRIPVSEDVELLDSQIFVQLKLVRRLFGRARRGSR